MLGQPKPNQNSLLLDVGNTSIKYAWYGYPDDIADLRVLKTSLDSLPELLEDAQQCYLCSVQSDEIAQAIENMCKTQNIAFTLANTQKYQFGLSNAYSKHSNMGSDRWLGMLAGGALSQNNYLVIDAGTAITCDFVVKHQHKGGWIAPGLSMARSSVVSNTKRVFDNDSLPHTLGLGIDTPDCVAQGALAQLTGMIVQACSLMRTFDGKFDVFMSGGDSALLIEAVSQLQKILGNKANYTAPINYIENLVLVGLARLAHEKAATND